MRFDDEEDRDSLRRFFVENQTTLLAHARFLTRNHHDAQDLLGQTAYKLARSWHKSRKRNLGYAKVIMNNAWKDSIKKKKRRPKAVPLELSPDKADTGQDAERIAVVRERITAVMSSLTKREQAVFTMHAHDKLGFKEIATQLYISESTAFKTFKRIEQRLMIEAELDG